MKLRRVTIENFRAIESLSLSFLDDFGDVRPITVLAGPNGCGKTSILFAIIQALRGLTGYHTEDVPVPSGLDIRRTERRGDVWHAAPPPPIRVEFEIEFDGAERRTIPAFFRRTRGITLTPLDDGRLSAAWVYPKPPGPDGKRPDWRYLDSWEPFGEHVLEWLMARHAAVAAWMAKQNPFDDIPQIGGLCLFPQDRSLRQRVLGEAGPAYPSGGQAPRLDSAGGQPSPLWDRPVVERLSELSQYVRGAHENGLPDEKNWEKRIQEAFGRICAPKEYLGVLYRGDDTLGAPCFRDGDHVYPLQTAASGEQVVMEYLARLTFPVPFRHSLILIDEPEVHLHPAWTRQLYLALPRIGEANQYILTTHSPELRGLAAADRALIDLGQLEGIKA